MKRTLLTSLALVLFCNIATAAPMQQAYIKASNTGSNDLFGLSMALSGNTMVVGASREDGSSRAVNGDDTNNSAVDAGAAYVFVRHGTNWVQQAYLKPSNLDAGDRFGTAVGISGDTIVVTATGEDGNGRGAGGDPNNNTINNAGAAYVFVRNGTNWTQQAYLKASNTESGDAYGTSVAISADTVVVGASFEKSNATGVNGNSEDNSLSIAGAAYVYVRAGTNWGFQAYLKASDTTNGTRFGGAVAVYGDIIVVGATGDTATSSLLGAAYVFVRTGRTWRPQALLRGSNTSANDNFGHAVSVSGDTIVVGAIYEDSDSSGINGNQGDVEDYNSGAAYVFRQNGTNWHQEAYLKASKSAQGDGFGSSVSISEDAIAVGALGEDSDAIGINGADTNDTRSVSGAAYVFVRHGTNWSEQAFLKASNPDPSDRFGDLVAISGNTMASSTRYESGGSSGINGDQQDNSVPFSGAAYVFGGLGVGPRLDVAGDGGSGYYIRGLGVTGLRYQLERADDVTGPWTTNGTTTAVAPGRLEIHDTNAPSVKAFYRAIQTD